MKKFSSNFCQNVNLSSANHCVHLPYLRYALPVIKCMISTGSLPNYYITKEQAITTGWKPGKALNNFAPGKALGGNRFYNREKLHLPTAPKRVWYEADIGQDYTKRRKNNPGYRIIYSNDNMIYGSCDHYKTIFPIYL